MAALEPAQVGVEGAQTGGGTRPGPPESAQSEPGRGGPGPGGAVSRGLLLVCVLLKKAFAKSRSLLCGFFKKKSDLF